MTKNFIVIHDQYVRFNALKFVKHRFTWDALLSCYENDEKMDSYVSKPV